MLINDSLGLKDSLDCLLVKQIILKHNKVSRGNWTGTELMRLWPQPKYVMFYHPVWGLLLLFMYICICVNVEGYHVRFRMSSSPSLLPVICELHRQDLL